MINITTPAPFIMPLLGRGMHQSPRHGACFMELASYLAGERWSDSPACTHWALAQLARLVNDLSNNEARPRLAEMVPAVIGQRDFDDHFAEDLALLAAVHALPISSPEHERTIVLGILRILGEAGEYLHSAHEPWPTRARAVLATRPEAADSARRYAATMGTIVTRSSVATTLTLTSARAIAEADVPDVQDRLRDLLAAGITWAQECSGTDSSATPELAPDQWQAVVQSA